MIEALGGAKALLPAGALATASIVADAGWEGLVTVVREAGLGVALLYVVYRTAAPWVARTLESQRARVQEAEAATEKRVEQLEREAHDLRAQVIELVRESAALQSHERAHQAELRTEHGKTRIAELERDRERAKVERLTEQLEAQRPVAHDLRRESDS